MTITANAIDRLYEKATIVSLAPEDELHLRSICIHEGGHSRVAAAFGIANDYLVAGPGAGVCAHAPCADLVKVAAIGWGGVLAEALMGMPFRGRKLPHYKPTSANLYDWCREVPLHSLSQPDQDGIRGCDLYEGCKVAFDILSSSLDILEYIASSLAERSRKTYAENSRRTERSLDFELDAFSVLFHAGQRARAAERKTDKPLADTDATTEALPPCQVPSAFNFSTFLANTGASEIEMDDFVKDRTRRDAWGVGRAAGDEEFRTAITFFREHQVSTRGMWVTMAKEFHSWRQQQTQIERSTNEH
jgi:hypothetical protein